MGACSSKNAVKKAPSDDSSTDRESLFTAVETDDEQSVAKLCATRDTKIAARLLQAGADVDEQDNNGVTALRYAVAHGNADVAEFLRANGAAEVEGGRLSISPSAAGEEVPETFTDPSPRSAGEASAGAASL